MIKNEIKNGKKIPNLGHLGYFEAQQPIYKIVEGWHKLFVGDNGVITNGITVESITSPNHWSWNINDLLFISDPTQIKEKLGLNDGEYNRYLRSLEFLVEEQKKTNENTNN